MNIFDTVLNPKSVAVVGASRSPEKVGFQVLQNIVNSGYKGSIFPINPKAKTINKLKACPSLINLPESPELTVIVTPKGLVQVVLEEAIQVKSKAAIIISAGFAESGIKGKIIQDNIQKITSGKIRVIGPNCLGVLSPVNQFNASFGPPLGIPGPVMLISQSGAMVTGVLDWSQLSGLGVSHAVTFGNRIDVSEVDALEYALHDAHTKVILTYLESFQSAPEFFSLASRVTPIKPIILLKGGSSKSGQAASASHTAALATDQVLVRSIAEQTGVILAEDMNHWLLSAQILTKTKPSNGSDIAIITNAGGPGVVTSDEAESHSLSIVPITGQSKNHLTQSLSHLAVSNPLDIRGDASPDDFATAIKILKTDAIQDALIVIITPQTTTQPTLAAKKIVKQAKDSSKPIVVVLIGGSQMLAARKILDAANISNYSFPAQAVSLLATKIRYESERKNILPYPSKLNLSKSTKALNNDTLTLKSAFRLLSKHGFNLPKFQLVSQISEIPSALKSVGKPAIAKTASMKVVHKVLSGGVVMGIMTNSQARLAFRQLQTIHSKVLYQQTIHSQHEVIIGAKYDPQFGPFLTVGMGGSLTDSLEDRQYAFLPTRKSSLKHVLKKTKIYKQIGSNQNQVDAVLLALTQTQDMILSHPEILELEINPLLVASQTTYAVDIKIKLK